MAAAPPPAPAPPKNEAPVPGDADLANPSGANPSGANPSGANPSGANPSAADPAARRRQLDRAREEAARLVAEGAALGPLIDRLAAEDRVALVEVVIGPRAPASPALVHAALAQLPALEAEVPPKALYQRLAALSASTAEAVLDAAIARHPAASWLVALSARIEGPRAGLRHLRATAPTPVFARACQLHVEAGHETGLIEAAAATGRPEPTAALAGAGRLDAAARALVRTLEQHPESAVVAWAAAASGPDPEPLLLACVRQLRDGGTARRLEPWLRPSPRARQLLHAVQPALPAAR